MLLRWNRTQLNCNKEPLVQMKDILLGHIFLVWWIKKLRRNGSERRLLSCSMEVAFGWRWSGRDGLWDTKKCFLFPLGPYTVVLRFSREAPYIKAKWHFQWLSQVSYSKIIMSKIVTWQVYKRRKTSILLFPWYTS